MKSLFILLAVTIMFTSCSQKKVSYQELESKYGALEKYTPKAHFVHFKTVDGYQIDCLMVGDRYQFLSKSKIK